MSKARDSAESASEYGTLGATVGTAIPGLGTVAGGALGAGLGGLLGYFGGSADTDKLDWEKERLGKLRQFQLEDDKRKWERRMQGLQAALAQMQGSRDMAARFAGAGRPDGPPPARMVDTPPGMSDAQHINALMTTHGGPPGGGGQMPGVTAGQIGQMKRPNSTAYLAAMLRGGR